MVKNKFSIVKFFYSIVNLTLINNSENTVNIIVMDTD